MSGRDIKSHHVEDFLSITPLYSINALVNSKRGVSKVKKEKLLKIKEHFIKTGDWLEPVIKSKTKKNVMTMLRDFCGWLSKMDILPRIPFMPDIKVQKEAIEWIEKDEQLAILDQIAPRHKPVFTFLIYHPVRPSEARALKVRDFDLQSMIVLISKTWSENEIRERKSGGEPYYLPISSKFDISHLKNKFPDAFAFLNQYGRPYKEDALRKIWHRARIKAGIPNIKFYNGTRHSTATQARKAGVDLSVISNACGHSSLETTRRNYAAFSVGALKAVVDGSPSIGSPVVPLRENGSG